MPIFEKNNSRSLEAAVRPGAFDIKGQQVELFPFDAFTFSREGISTTSPEVALKDPWVFGIKPNQITSVNILNGTLTSPMFNFGEEALSLGELSDRSILTSIYGSFDDTSGLLSDGTSPTIKRVLPGENAINWASDRSFSHTSDEAWYGWSFLNIVPQTDGSLAVIETESEDWVAPEPEAAVVYQPGPQGPAGPTGPQGPQGDEGPGLEYNWSGTELGVRAEGDATYVYVDLEGPTGPTGPEGPVGEISTGTPFYTGPKTITADKTMTELDDNYMTIGPITIADGVTVTVDGGNWVIV